MKKYLFLMVIVMAFVIPVNNSTAAIAYNNYIVQGRDNNTGEYIISTVNIKDFGVKGDGQTDDTSAILAALRNVSRNKGSCVIYFPPGKYRITKPGIIVYSQMTLRGHWNKPSNDTQGEQTIFIADYDPQKTSSASGDALFELQGNASIRDLCVYYPRLSSNRIKEYNYTIWISGHMASVQNITLYNSFKGINAGTEYGGSAHFIKDIYGTILKEGIRLDWNYEVSAISNIHFSAAYWKSYDSSVDIDTITNFTKANAEAICVGKVDDLFVYDLNAGSDEFKTGIKIYYNQDIPNPPKIAYGLLSKLNGSSIAKEDRSDPNMPIICNVDEVQRSSDYQYVFAKDRYPTRSEIYNVKAAPYNAKGDGLSDDTESIKKAINEAGSKGGGTVLLPAGQYKITSKVILPQNVELRGEWDACHPKSPSQINVSFGKGDPDGAVIELSAFSGVHGLTFYLPEHSFNSISPYPWIIKGMGEACWAEYITLVNTYNGINMYDNKCDNFLIKGVWGTAVHEGIKVGGGSQGGRLEYNFISFAQWYEAVNRADDKKIESYTYANATGYIFGNCRDISAISLSIFGLKYGIVFQKEGRGQAENVSIIRSLLDTPFGMACLHLKAGNNLSFIGLSTGNHPEKDRPSSLIKVEGSFAGKALIYGQNKWGGAENSLAGKNVKIYDASSTGNDFIDHKFAFVDPVYGEPQGTDKPDSSKGCADSGCGSSGHGAALAALIPILTYIKGKEK